MQDQVIDINAPTPADLANDPRAKRINQLLLDQKRRSEIISEIEKAKGFNNFVHNTIENKGRIAGLYESMDLAPYTPPAPAPQITADNAASAFEIADQFIQQIHDALPAEERDEFLASIAEKYFDETDVDLPDNSLLALTRHGMRDALRKAKDLVVAKAVIQNGYDEQDEPIGYKAASNAYELAERDFDALLDNLTIELPMPANASGDRDALFGWDPDSKLIVNLKPGCRNITPDEAPQAAADLLFAAKEAEQEKIPTTPPELHKPEPVGTLVP